MANNKGFVRHGLATKGYCIQCQCKMKMNLYFNVFWLVTVNRKLCFWRVEIWVMMQKSLLLFQVLLFRCFWKSKNFDIILSWWQILKIVLNLLLFAEVLWAVAILRGGLVGACPQIFACPPVCPPPSFFLNFKIVWLAYEGLPNAFCKNTGHSANSARSKLCRNS